MNKNYIVDIIYRVLKINHIKTNKRVLIKALWSDPTYPSAISIINTFRLFGVKAVIYKSDIDALYRCGNVCIVHNSGNKGHFFLLENKYESYVTLFDSIRHKVPLSKFKEMWDGYVIVIESVHNARLLQRKCSLGCYFTIFLLILLLSLPLIDKPYNIVKQILLDYAAFVICGLLLYHKVMNINNDRWCKIGKYFDCNAVKLPLFKTIDINPYLPCVGLLYFFFDVINIWDGNMYITVLWYRVSLLVIILLFMYQLVIIRRFCALCILVGMIVIVKNIIINESISQRFYEANLETIYSFIFAYFIVASIYIFLLREKRFFYTDIHELKLKRIMWKHCLNSSIKQNISVEDSDIVFGKSKVNNVITTIVRPGCEHCEKLEKLLQSILQNDINIKWQIFLDGVLVDDEKLFSKMNQKQLNILRRYYCGNENISMSYLSATKPRQHQTDSDFSKEELAVYRLQLERIGRLHYVNTPTIYINGIYVKPIYQTEDLPYIINDTINFSAR